MDPERPIEKLLRAAAKKRRDQAGAPFELHPADRKLLQAEVGRKYAKDKRSSSLLQSLLVGWPRLVWVTAIFAVLAIIAFMLVPGPNKTNTDAFMAQNTPMPVELPRRELSPAPRPGLTEQLGTRSTFSDRADLADKNVPEKGAISETPQSLSLSARVPGSPTVPATVAELKQAEPGSAPSLGGAAGKSLSPPEQTTTLAKTYGIMTVSAPSETPVPAAPATTAEFFNRSPDNAKLAFSTKPSVAASPPAPAVPTATDALAKTDNSNNDRQPTISQRFTQIQQPTKAKTAKLESVPASPQVLVAFQVEQIGSELRIIDGDGSVYTGQLVEPEAYQARFTESRDTAAEVNRVQLRERSFQPPTGSVSPLQNYSFRVTGTNRSINQKVVFNGNLAAATNAASMITNSVNTGLSNLQNSGALQNSNPLSNSRISGRAQIGKGKEIPIEAISTP